MPIDRPTDASDIAPEARPPVAADADRMRGTWDRPADSQPDSKQQPLDRPDRATDTPAVEGPDDQQPSWFRPGESPEDRYQRALTDTAPGDALLDEGVKSVNTWTEQHAGTGANGDRNQTHEQ